MTLLSTSALLKRPSVANAAILARQLSAIWETKSAADIIRERASLSAVHELTGNPGCSPIDIESMLRRTSGCNSHFGYDPIAKVEPLAFAWSSSSNYTQQLLPGAVPKDRLPDALHSLDSIQRIQTPMVTLIDHINENVCGHPGLIHGGMTTIIANSSLSLVAALNAPENAHIMPLSLNMDYRKPIHSSDFVKIHAWLYRNSGDQMKAAVHFYSLKNEMLVEAVADIAIRPPPVVQ
ncbi:hypothetical protein IW140_005125 [Coemansia sp. RSA 1813]|nr:hypothetical protein EV178_005925 [Coemansia sp. RSA 1646]KAJ1767476.1 hypothetical protein LPJ74_005343 [Coemansia sp. RSA 1843]KAJ2211984.1 hypothetical protein EV179_005028 [Coemansia sp. RSA 487]KAJ2565970.1 hypothetical protein IW140_005125 [Coemansia sp. RSA 1813]